MAKAAIVTGSSRGIGAAFARRLGKMGYNVAINYVSDSSKSSAEQLATEISHDHRHSRWLGYGPYKGQRIPAYG